MTTLALVAAFAQFAGCLPVAGDYVTAADLAAAIPELAAIDPSEQLGYTPNPGAVRTFRAPDIGAIAQRYGVEVRAPRDVCFEWELRAIQPQDVTAAMQKALADPSAKIEVVEISRAPAPKGELVFDVNRLTPPANDDGEQAVTWNGFIEYGARRRFSVWARVRLSSTSERIIAARPIRAGATITADDLRVETFEAFPRRNRVRLEDVVGQVSLRPLREGMVVLPQSLREAPLVRSGDDVSVIVHAGAAVIKTGGRAESGGKLGETVAVRNPASSKMFKAVVVGPKSVRVTARGN